jgi:hypothetical protein
MCLARGNALKQWKLACPKGDLGLVFQNEKARLSPHLGATRVFKMTNNTTMEPF